MKQAFPRYCGETDDGRAEQRVNGAANGAANASSEGEQMLIIKGPRCTITVDLLAESGERSSFDLAA